MKNALYTLLVAALLLTGCGYCADPQHAQEPRCQAQAIVVDCSKAGAISEAPNLLPLVKWILSGAPGGQMDWQTLLQSLMHTGFELVGCTAEQLDNAFALKMQALEHMRSGPDGVFSAEAEVKYKTLKALAPVIHDNWRSFMNKTYPNVHYKLPAVNPLLSVL